MTLQEVCCHWEDVRSELRAGGMISSKVRTAYCASMLELLGISFWYLYIFLTI